MDGTPIYDIKPYLPYADAHPEATGGFTDGIAYPNLEVDFPPELLAMIPGEKRRGLMQALSQDPRPGYRQEGDGRRYGMEFAGFDVRFTVDGNILRVREVVPLKR